MGRRAWGDAGRLGEHAGELCSRRPRFLHLTLRLQPDAAGCGAGRATRPPLRQAGQGRGGDGGKRPGGAPRRRDGACDARWVGLGWAGPNKCPSLAQLELTTGSAATCAFPSFKSCAWQTFAPLLPLSNRSYGPSLPPRCAGPVVLVVDCPSAAFLPALAAAPQLKDCSSGSKRDKGEGRGVGCVGGGGGAGTRSKAASGARSLSPCPPASLHLLLNALHHRFLPSSGRGGAPVPSGGHPPARLPRLAGLLCPRGQAPAGGRVCCFCCARAAQVGHPAGGRQEGWLAGVVCGWRVLEEKWMGRLRKCRGAEVLQLLQRSAAQVALLQRAAPRLPPSACTPPCAGPAQPARPWAVPAARGRGGAGAGGA